jgi:hypothetical protein
MRITDQYFWNIVFSVFFLALISAGGVILHNDAYRAYVDLTWIDIFILSFATLRFTRLMVYDAITAFFREQFWDPKEVRGKVELVKPEAGPRKTLADLMGCPWCFGVWAGATVTFFYLLTPYAYFPVLLLAISGVGSLLQITGNMVGWRAESLKNDVESRL